MKVCYVFFASKRYWSDAEKLRQAFDVLAAQWGGDHPCVLCTDGEQPRPAADCMVAVPMSGAVQRELLGAARGYACTVVLAAYVRGNAPQSVTDEMLRCNAAPTVMDCWAVLRRTHPCAQLALSACDLARALRLQEAYLYVRTARLLLIGDTEPWVVSNSADAASYEKRFGLTVKRVPQAQLAALYRAADRRQAEPYYAHFRAGAARCEEPTDDDLWRAARMASALVQLMESHRAQGCALACFNLLREGTNCCLGVSYINDCTGMVAACEGDLDSAVTMLMMKKLTSTRLWMANPGLQPDGSVHFSHCTAPLCAAGEALPCTLRSHHESGIGVSLQVELPAERRVTACRVSDEASCITVQNGTTAAGPYECACRTQLYVHFDDPQHYLDTALGCHQVFAFEDIARDVRTLAGWFGLRLL